MAKKHVHRWCIYTTLDRKVEIACNVEGCVATMKTTEAERIINTWERRPRYRKQGTAFDIASTWGPKDPKWDMQLYVRIPKGKR